MVATKESEELYPRKIKELMDNEGSYMKDLDRCRAKAMKANEKLGEIKRRKHENIEKNKIEMKKEKDIQEMVKGKLA